MLTVATAGYEVSTCADENPLAVYLARLAPGGRRSIASDLERIARILTSDAQGAATLPWAALRYQHVAAVRAALVAHGYAPATVNHHLAALRAVLKEAWRLGQMTAEDYHRAVDVRPVEGDVDALAGRSLTRDECAALFAACARDLSPAGRRDAAMLAILMSLGPRRASIVAIDFADYGVEGETLTLRHVKRGGTQRLPIASGVARALVAWLAVRGAAPGVLFTRMNRAGRQTARRLTEQAIYDVCRQRAAEAGIAHFSPHDLRRTVVTDLLDQGVDLLTVGRLVGHARPETTKRYDRRGERAMRAAVEARGVPYIAPR